MDKNFNATDLIELGLYKHTAEYYYLKYRSHPKQVKIHILWFYVFVTVKDPWHALRLYKSTVMPDVHPDDEALWRPVSFNIIDNHDMEHYNHLKKEVKTYEQIDKAYNITRREKQYELDKLRYKLANSK